MLGGRYLSLRCLSLVVALVAAFVLAATGRVARAEESEYQTAVKEALAEFDRGNWDEAYSLFRRAHKLEPSARTLNGMGLAAFEGRRYTISIQHLSAALADRRKPLGGDLREKAGDTLERALSFVGRFSYQLSPARAEVRVDGRAARLDDEGRLLLDPGTHDIVVTAAGFQRVSQRLEVSGGDRGELSWHLTEVDDTPSVAAVPVEAPPAPPERSQGGDARDGTSPGEPRTSSAEADTHDASTEQTEGASTATWGFVAAGGAVAFAGAALTLHLLAVSGVDDVENACTLPCTPARVDAEIEDANIETFQTLSIVGWSLAGASAVTAAVLFLVDGSGTEQPDLALAPTPSGAALFGRF